MAAVLHDVSRQFGGQRCRNRNWCPGNLGLQQFNGILHLRLDDAAPEVNIPRPQPARLGETQADKSAEQYGAP